jgi:DNA-directed RNA polymerase
MKKSKDVLSAPLFENSQIAKQIETEVQATQSGVDRYRGQSKDAIKRGDGASVKPAERLCVYWFEPLEAAIADEIDQSKKGMAGRNRGVVGPILSMLDPAKLAVVTMHETLGLCMDESTLFTIHDKKNDESKYESGVKYSTICYSIGRSVMAEINLVIGKKTQAESLKQLMIRLKMNKVRRINWWANKNLDCEKTSRIALTMVGDSLLYLLMCAASCKSYEEQFVPAFFHKRVRVGSKDIGFFGLTDEAWSIIDDGHAIREKLRPRYLPMVITPLAWQEKNDHQDRAEGGYVRIRTPLISKITKSQREYLLRADLNRVFDCLNAVCSVGLRINKRMLAVVEHVWNTGGGVMGIPKRDPEPIPDRPADYKSMDALTRQKWRRSCCAIHRRNIATKSERKQVISTIAIAEQFVDEETIYYPHQMDYRGRCYPISQPLHHQGMDHHVSMMQFSNGLDAPVSEVFVHAANCYGYDKVSYKEREEWGHANMRAMLECAEDPQGTEFWRLADKPFQFLAACFALRYPEDAAHLPISSDGTCNGLQHYAAMLRDDKLARLVNLIPGYKPESIYTIVTENLVKSVNEDIINAVGQVQYAGENNTLKSITIRELAKLSLPFAIRKVVKQPVMTDLYGVTLTGARLQVQGILSQSPTVTKEMRFPLAMYLARKILSSIGDVCASARAAMEWIRGSASLICDENRPVVWHTPLGLPVVQPHRRLGKYKIETIMQKITLAVHDMDLPVNKRQQVDGSAPNLLHSLDSTHMLITAKACRDLGLDFMATHDRFFSHAATKHVIANINRKQFIKVHEVPYLQVLQDQWMKTHPDIKFKPCPQPGSLDISCVLNSPYFFN